jgi:hypothetical protein
MVEDGQRKGVSAMPGNPMITDQSLTGATLEWGHPELTTSVHHSQFTNCDITINCAARGILISDSVFENCSIRVTKLFKDYQFFRVGFECCHFIGNYSGCEFGFRNALAPRRAMHGYVRNCDFFKASLDLVAFNGADFAGLHLPPWPHFLVKSPIALASVKKLADDPEWRILAGLKWAPEATGLVVLYRHGGRRGFSLPPAEALEILSQHADIQVSSPGL